jgi:hypothetical protein
MGELEARESSFLAGIRRNQWPLAIAGGVISLLGAVYLAWAILRFNPNADPRVDPGFDRPIAQLAFIFERGQLLVEKAEPATPSEARMLRALARNMQFSAGIMVLQVRMFVGTLALIGGFIMVTVVVERARLLRLIRRLQE